MISPIANSTTDLVLEYGALKTATPFSLQASTSICLVPIQKAPTANNLSEASTTL